MTPYTTTTTNGASRASGNPCGSACLTNNAMSWTCPAWIWMTFPSMPDSITMFYVVSYLKKRLLQTSASINGKKMPTTSLLMMNCMPKGILSNEPTLGWTIQDATEPIDTTVSSWILGNYLAFAVLLLKKISRRQKV